jgi:agmatine deiminase
MDGGNLVTSGTRVIMTRKILQENPRWKPDGLRSRLEKLLQIDQCTMIPKEKGDVIGHSDGLVRFLNENLVIINDYSRIEPEFGNRLRKLLVNQGLQVEMLPHFREDRADEGIPSAVGNYVNFLRVGNLIVVPAYGSPKDAAACKKLERLCPKATVVPLECRQLGREGGVLNCVAWTIHSCC